MSPHTRAEFLREPQPMASAAWHSLLWLVVANAIGAMLAVLLLFPALNRLLGEWTYGRWMMVHMNLELYGWTALPLVGFLFRVYGADRGRLALWCRPALWAWSAALIVGSISWLSGYSSGKLFLDWSGYAGLVFPAALLALWLLLLVALMKGQFDRRKTTRVATAAKLAGLLVLLAVPFAIYLAANPNLYPAVNPDTGGPTGASQLESSLAIVLILLLLPFGITRRREEPSKSIAAGWIVLIAESLLCSAMSRADVSYRQPVQYLSLGLLMVWLPLTPAYYAAFEWNESTRRWRQAFLWWWATLVITGWIMFLPPVLDRFKFTDALVGHSFIATAGFTSSLLIFVMVQLLGEGAWIFNRLRSFYVWQAAVVGYIVVMSAAGCYEAADPSFTIVPGLARDILYSIRLLTGILMLLASLDWLADASTLLGHSSQTVAEVPQEKTA